MAFVEIEIDESQSSGDFFRFDAIGKTLNGRFVSFKAEKGNFEKLDQNYTFKTAEGLVTVSAPAKLAQALERAALKPNQAVKITYTKDLPPTNPNHSPMKMFKVLVEDLAGGAAPAAPSAAEVAAKAKAAAVAKARAALAAAEAGNDEDVPY